MVGVRLGAICLMVLAAAYLPAEEPLLGSRETESVVTSSDVLVSELFVEDGEFAVPAPAPPPEDLVESLSRRLADVEKQLKKRDDADKKADDAAGKKFVVRPFGRVHIDGANFEQDTDNRATVGNAMSGFDLRRARFGFEGEGFDTFFYRFDIDFASLDAGSNNAISPNKRPVVVDAYIDTLNLPLMGNLRVGRFREPFGLDRLDSTHDLPFMERALPTNALVPFRNLGLMGFDCNEAETMTWAYGVFTENSNAYGEALPSSGGIAATGRATWLPWYDEFANGRYLFHLGASYSYRLVSNHRTRFGTIPEIGIKQDTALSLFQTPRFVNTPLIDMLDYHVAGVEALTHLGSLTLQGEYTFVQGDQIGNPNLFFHGGYVEAMYFLTGEHRSYLRKLGIHGPTLLHNNFFRVDTEHGIQTGPGAWEATARVSTLDLNSQNINGGQLTDLTLGLSWYFAPRSRIMFNYVHAFLEAKGLNTTVTDSNADIYAVRYQWAF